MLFATLFQYKFRSTTNPTKLLVTFVVTTISKIQSTRYNIANPCILHTLTKMWDGHLAYNRTCQMSLISSLF